MKLKNHNHGFTLLEILLVIAVIAILAGIVIVAINPGRQLAQARNAQRASDLRALHSAVNQYYIDNKVWPSNLETVTTLTEICNTGAEGIGHSIDCATDSLVDLSPLVPNYISAIPTDPLVTASLPFTNNVYAQTAANGTGYMISINSFNRSVALLATWSEEYGLAQVHIGNIQEVSTYTINFDNQGGTPSSNTITDIPYNTTVTLPAEPSREGFIFNGWYTEQDGQGIQLADTTVVTQTITVYASWNAENYLLTYDPNEGQDAPNPENRQYQNNDPLSPNEPTRTGYSFLHWNTENDDSGVSYNPGQSFTMPSSNATLHAIWSINQYTLTFNTDGGSSVSFITQDYGTTITPPADPTKSGYTFVEWSPAIPGNMPASNETHTAVWEAAVATFIYITDNSSGKIKKIDDDGNLISTTPVSTYVRGFDVDNNGNLIIGDGKMLKKYDVMGNEIFNIDILNYPYSFYSLTSIYPLVTDNLGNIYIGLTRWSTSPQYPTILKLDPNGNVIWTANYGSIVGTIFVDDDLNVYIGGYSNAASGYITTRKYNSNGILQWSVNHGGGDGVNEVKVDSNGNVYTVGTRIGGITTRKYGPNGNLIWSRDDGANMFGLDIDQDNNIYVAGGYITRKYDPNGSILWTKTLASTKWRYSLALDDDGYVYSGGNDSVSDYALVKYDFDGNFIWQKPIGRISKVVVNKE